MKSAIDPCLLVSDKLCTFGLLFCAKSIERE
jgi:hypothetical protein